MAFWYWLALASLACLTTAQSNSAYCDGSSGICFSGYTDPDLDITVGFVLPPDDSSAEYIVQIVAPVSYGWTGISMSGTMANGLLFVIWPNDGEIVFSTRWTDGYTQPAIYTGPTITMLPSAHVNSTHIQADFRCQNCTIWEGGSLGSGSTTGFELIAYVCNSDTPPTDPSDPASDFTEHDNFDFFGADLSTAHSSSYDSYIGSVSGTTTTTAPSPTTSSEAPSSSTSATTTSDAPTATQTKYGQCGGQGWMGPTVCASGSTCTAISPPYYSQCI